MTDTLGLDIQWAPSNLRFVEDERNIIIGAVEHIQNYFLDDIVVANAIDDKVTPEEDEYYMFSDAAYNKWYKVRDHFLYQQRETLKHREGVKISFKPIDLPKSPDGSITFAEADSGIVNAAEGNISRDFYVKLNKMALGNSAVLPDTAYDKSFWASVIVHEMLHNLGHRHPKGKYNCYFVREYEHAFYTRLKNLDNNSIKWEHPDGYTCGDNTHVPGFLTGSGPIPIY